MRVAAVQLDARLGAVDDNLAACERLVAAACAEGAEVVALPEFFTTGIGFVPELAEAALPPDGAATVFLAETARRHGIHLGGSFLCDDPDGECRNAYLLAGPDGRILGRHDKDLPTMWENAFYIGGDDSGVIDTGAGWAAGAVVCWEFMRTQTVHRLCGEVDLVVGGSGWWSVPGNWYPGALMRQQEAGNAANARRAVAEFAGLVGAPVVHGAHCGSLSCRVAFAPLPYRGHFEGGASVVAADGSTLAYRDHTSGPGHVIAEVTIGSQPPIAVPPKGFWLRDRGAVAAFAWHADGAAGRRWYRKHRRAKEPTHVAQ
ncbi:carbon-nitrogen hydrolase family protein [Nocardia sp. 2]|uniref:Carbon-nitrogen hydrolase family protein n=1 Tax=Nocardia acididurans TaxID=2802282 RepID=A0ABS1M1I3_9NOCA|nr:carbon-nitrogen hydrolase family protein [Nocardia acididurans]MBL1073935.1 carbon-nitrogen hydrolase family protein [Nocardia acididurans]